MVLEPRTRERERGSCGETGGEGRVGSWQLFQAEQERREGLGQGVAEELRGG